MTWFLAISLGDFYSFTKSPMMLPFSHRTSFIFCTKAHKLEKAKISNLLNF